MWRSRLGCCIVWLCCAAMAQGQCPNCGNPGCGGPPAYGDGPYYDQYYGEDHYQFGNFFDSVGSNLFGGDCYPRSQFYLGAFGGWVNLNDYADVVAQPPPYVIPAYAEFKNGFALGVSIGRRVGYSWRTECEFAYRTNSADRLGLLINQAGQTTTANVPLNGDIRSYSGMANWYFDFFVFGTPKLTPYVGGGLGFAFVDTHLVYAGESVLRADDSAFAFQAIAGVNFRLSQRIELFTEYRFFGTDKIHLFASESLMAGGPDYELRDFRYLSHNIFAGVHLILR